MQNFEQSVGEGGRNLKHDVAVLQAALKLLTPWQGEVDGAWHRHGQDLIAAIRQAQARANIRVGQQAVVQPAGPLANWIFQQLPAQYKTMRGVKDTACLVVKEQFQAPRFSGSGPVLPSACKADLEKLANQAERSFGFSIAVQRSETTLDGCCCVELALKGVTCLGKDLAQLRPHESAPQELRDGLQRMLGMQSSFRMNPRGSGLELLSNAPVNRLRGNGRGSEGQDVFLAGEAPAMERPLHKANIEQARRLVDGLIEKGTVPPPTYDGYVVIDVKYDPAIYKTRGGGALFGRNELEGGPVNRGTIYIYPPAARDLREAIITYAHELGHFNQAWKQSHNLIEQYGQAVYAATLSGVYDGPMPERRRF